MTIVIEQCELATGVYICSEATIEHGREVYRVAQCVCDGDAHLYRGEKTITYGDPKKAHATYLRWVRNARKAVPA